MGSVRSIGRVEVKRPYHHRHTEDKRHAGRQVDQRCHDSFLLLPALVGADPRAEVSGVAKQRENRAGLLKGTTPILSQGTGPTEKRVDGVLEPNQSLFC